VERSEGRFGGESLCDRHSSCLSYFVIKQIEVSEGRVGGESLSERERWCFLKTRPCRVSEGRVGEKKYIKLKKKIFYF
jgi:hypothetical protein